MAAKYVEYEIAGRRLRLLRTVYAEKLISDKFGSVEDYARKLNSGEPLIDQMWDSLEVFSILAKCGKANAELMGETADFLEPDELANLIPTDDQHLAEVFNILTDALTHGGKTEIETKKNDDDNVKN